MPIFFDGSDMERKGRKDRKGSTVASFLCELCVLCALRRGGSITDSEETGH